MMSKFFFNVLLNVFQIQISLINHVRYSAWIVLYVAVYFFRGQFTSVVLKGARSDASLSAILYSNTL